MPKYPWKSYSPLRTHDFGDTVFRDGEEPGDLFVCRTCERRFKFDSDAHRTWAVGKGRSSPALHDSVSSRWISEPCSGVPSAKDADDSKRLKPSGVQSLRA